MDNNDSDDSIFALLADDDNDGPSYRQLPATEIWNDDCLVMAFNAAVAEYRDNLKTPSTRLPLLDREEQLKRSPLWYAPLCPPSTSTLSKSNSKRQRSASLEESVVVIVADEEDIDEEEGHDGPYEDEEVIETQSTLLPSTKSKPISTIHPSRLDHVKHEGQPYFDPAEWEPVAKPNKARSIEGVVVVQDTPTHLAIPDPPSVQEAAIPEALALLATQPPQEAMQKALEAWYNAGYAAALYHIRSGLVKP